MDRRQLVVQLAIIQVQKCFAIGSQKDARVAVDSRIVKKEFCGAAWKRNLLTVLAQNQFSGSERFELSAQGIALEMGNNESQLPQRKALQKIRIEVIAVLVTDVNKAFPGAVPKLFSDKWSQVMI